MLLLRRTPALPVLSICNDARGGKMRPIPPSLPPSAPGACVSSSSFENLSEPLGKQYCRDAPAHQAEPSKEGRDRRRLQEGRSEELGAGKAAHHCSSLPSASAHSGAILPLLQLSRFPITHLTCSPGPQVLCNSAGAALAALLIHAREMLLSGSSRGDKTLLRAGLFTSDDPIQTALLAGFLVSCTCAVVFHVAQSHGALQQQQDGKLWPLLPDG